MVDDFARLPSRCNVWIPAIFEIVPALLGDEDVAEDADLALQFSDRSFAGGEVFGFEFGEGVFDGVEVGTVRREVTLQAPDASIDDFTSARL